MASSIVSFCEGLPLVQVFTSYYIWKLRSQRRVYPLSTNFYMRRVKIFMEEVCKQLNKADN